MWYPLITNRVSTVNELTKGSAIQQNCVRDYIIFEDYTGITPVFYRDYIICNSINYWRLRKTKNYGGQLQKITDYTVQRLQAKRTRLQPRCGPLGTHFRFHTCVTGLQLALIIENKYW